MIDASGLPFEKNVEMTRKVVEVAHPLGVSVEAELGTIGALGEDGGLVGKIRYTDPQEARRFVECTDVDALAVAIGTAHGPYPESFKPALKLDLLTEIRKAVQIPLVLHGGSSNPDDEIERSVELGINKVNISSDIKIAFFNQLRQDIVNKPNLREPYELYPDSIRATRQTILHKIGLFHSAGKAGLYSL